MAENIKPAIRKVQGQDTVTAADRERLFSIALREGQDSLVALFASRMLAEPGERLRNQQIADVTRFAIISTAPTAVFPTGVAYDELVSLIPEQNLTEILEAMPETTIHFPSIEAFLALSAERRNAIQRIGFTSYFFDELRGIDQSNEGLFAGKIIDFHVTKLPEEGDNTSETEDGDNIWGADYGKNPWRREDFTHEALNGTRGYVFHEQQEELVANLELQHIDLFFGNTEVLDFSHTNWVDNSWRPIEKEVPSSTMIYPPKTIEAQELIKITDIYDILRVSNPEAVDHIMIDGEITLGPPTDMQLVRDLRDRFTKLKRITLFQLNAEHFSDEALDELLQLKSLQTLFIEFCPESLHHRAAQHTIDVGIDDSLEKLPEILKIYKEGARATVTGIMTGGTEGDEDQDALIALLESILTDFPQLKHLGDKDTKEVNFERSLTLDGNHAGFISAFLNHPKQASLLKAEQITIKLDELDLTALDILKYCIVHELDIQGAEKLTKEDTPRLQAALPDKMIDIILTVSEGNEDTEAFLESEIAPALEEMYPNLSEGVLVDVG